MAGPVGGEAISEQPPAPVVLVSWYDG